MECQETYFSMMLENSLINLRTMREDDFLDPLTFITQLDPCIKRKLQEAKTKLHILLSFYT